MKPKGTTILAVIALLSLLLPQIAMARTWTVEKDGSGDFMVIQDALDAASSGDTILIGPGRFDELRVHTGLLNGVDDAAVMWVKTPNLTIIGSGAGSTIVGPSAYVGEFEGEKTASLIVDSGAECDLSNLGFENTRFEVVFFARTRFEDCRIARDLFRTDDSLSIGFCSGVEIRRVELVDAGAISTLPGASDVLIEDCTIEDSSDWTYAIQLSNSPPNCVVRRCTITGGAAGIQYSGTGVVEKCTLQGQTGTGLEVVGGGHMVARECVVGVTRTALWVTSGRLELEDSLLEGGTRETVFCTAELYVRRSHILNAGGWSIYGGTSTPGEFIDVRNNWWGSSDLAQIEAWIFDEYGTVLWEPIADMAIPTQDGSISELKGKFGRN